VRSFIEINNAIVQASCTGGVPCISAVRSKKQQEEIAG
jgi:hypothetical protein